MPTTTQIRISRESAASEHHQVPLGPERCEALDTSTIAELSATVIGRMTCDELIRVVRGAGLLDCHRYDVQRQLAFYDCETLRRLAHLARRYCQNLESRTTVYK